MISRRIVPFCVRTPRKSLPMFAATKRWKWPMLDPKYAQLQVAEFGPTKKNPRLIPTSSIHAVGVGVAVDVVGTILLCLLLLLFL